MQNLNPGFSFAITGTIKDIPESDWDNLFAQDFIEGYGYQKTLEESAIPGFQIGYLIAWRGQKLVFIAPFFVTDFSFSDFAKGPIRNVILKIQKKIKRFLKLRILFFGTLTAEELYIGISKNENPEAILDAAQEEISKFCKKEGISAFLFYNLNEKDAVLKEYLCRNHFIKLGSLPTTVMEINASSLEGYINGLKKNARKDLRRKLRRSTMQANLVTEIRDDIKGISEEIYKLYMNNFGDSDIHFELLPKRFFEDISENMPGVVKFFITRENAKIVAFNLCLVKRDFCIDKFIGLDPEVAREYHLYFTTLCHNIEWCIKNNIRFYQPGATDYHPKVRLGAKLIPLFIYAKGFNPLLNITVRLIAKLIEPKRLDSSLANIKKI